MQDLVFCTLTHRDGTDIRINARNIEAYYADEEGGTIICTTNGEYFVKEAPEDIDNFLCRYIEGA